MRVKNTNEHSRTITLSVSHQAEHEDEETGEKTTLNVIDDELVVTLDPGEETDVDDKFAAAVKACADLSVVSAKRAKEKE